MGGRSVPVPACGIPVGQGALRRLLWRLLLLEVRSASTPVAASLDTIARAAAGKRASADTRTLPTRGALSRGTPRRAGRALPGAARRARLPARRVAHPRGLRDGQRERRSDVRRRG